MEEDAILTTTNHLYEQDQCSGIFIYSVDNGKPSYIKFSERITIKVILDNVPPKMINHHLGSYNEMNLAFSNSYFNDINENHPQESLDSELPLVNTGDKNLEDTTTLTTDETSYPPVTATMQITSKSDHDSNSVKGLCQNDNEDPECEQFRFTNNSLTTKYNLRQKSGKHTKDNTLLIHEEDSLAGESNSLKSIIKLGGKSSKRGRKALKVGKKKNKGKTLKSPNKRLNNSKSFEIESSHSKGPPDENELLKDQNEKGEATLKLNKTQIDSELVSVSENSFKDDSLKIQNNRKSRPRKLLMEKDVNCNYCGVTFETKLDFFNHRRNKGSTFKCDICGKVEPFQAHLMVHMLSHEPQKGFVDDNVERENEVKKRRFKMKCSVCGLVVSSVDSLKVHMILHTGECPYRCCLCEDQQFFSLSSLRHHQEVHRISKRFQCKICSMRFTSRTELSKHKLNHDIKCGLCGELFPNKTSRSCHYRVSHPNDIKKCKECFSLFSTDEELEKHLMYHRKGKKEQCPECGIVVTKLKDHMILHSRNSGEKMFACDQCPMKYKRKSTLDKHLLVHTGERPYACNKCPKRFRSNGMLRKHLLTHTLEKPFVCEVCGKQCSVRSNLDTHMRIHAETRKYPCTLCFQAFNYKTSLDIHMKCKHNTPDISSFLTCIHCSQNFQDESSLTSHIMTAHPEPKSNNESRQDQPLPLPTAQEPTYITQNQNPPMMPFLYPDQPHAYRTSANHHVPMQNTSIHTILDLDKAVTQLDAVPNFPVQTSTIHISNNLTSSNMESFERPEMLSYFGRERTSMSHQSSILSVPPAFQYMPPGLEHVSHSINFSGVSMIDTSQKPAPDMHNIDGYEDNV